MPEGTSQPCPTCGISVMTGYVKCPKCHAPMPGGPASARQRRASMQAGGTTSQRIEVLGEGGGGGTLLYVIGALVLAGGLAIWATQCRGTRERPAAAANVADEGPLREAAVPLPGEQVPPILPTSGGPTGGGDPSFAADTLEGELAGERLFATVQVQGDVLDVRSAFCGEARLGEIIGRHASELRAAGVARVRCSETYGTQVFERGL